MPVNRDADRKCRLCTRCGHVFEERKKRTRRKNTGSCSSLHSKEDGSHHSPGKNARSGICPDCQAGKVKCFQCRSDVALGGDDACNATIACGRKDCRKVFHRECAASAGSYITKRGVLVCPHHICSACRSYRDSRLWRCCICPVAYHRSCSPEETVWLDSRLGLVVCWRHSKELKALGKEEGFSFEKFFKGLPLPQTNENFQLPSPLRAAFVDESMPPPFFHIKRNVYLVKRPKTTVEDSCCLCSGEKEMCGSDCLCRSISASCSRRCKCSYNCSNRPFRKDKKMSIVKTRYCGWGVEAGEDVKEGEFIIEYAGEVIDDALCEKRLWDLRARGAENFYMCEISKNLVIDASFKGNLSRYINHSCEPNCQLQKWQVDGETRIGVFASVDIPFGESLTYDYKFVGYENIQRCHCGTPKCQGFLNSDGCKMRKCSRLHKEEALPPLPPPPLPLPLPLPGPPFPCLSPSSGIAYKDNGKKRLCQRDFNDNSYENSDGGSLQACQSSLSEARDLPCGHYGRKPRKRRHDWAVIRLMLQHIRCAVEG